MLDASTHIKYGILETSLSQKMALLKIQTEMLKAIHDFLYERGLMQVMPVIISPITDSLNHSVFDASIQYYGQEFQLTKSMILHKQITLASIEVPGIYIMSPNVRLETREKKNSGRHLFEFTQVDIELRGATGEDFRDLLEELIIFVFEHINARCGTELDHYSGPLRVPKRPFKIYSSHSLRAQHGEDFEQILSEQSEDLFWITDFSREFYDKEDPKRPGHYINYDLFYPLGFNEALSGGERDYQYDILLRKILERKEDPQVLSPYLELAKENKLVPSAGGGLGVERLLRFITKQTHIEDVCLFPKVPGKKILF